jgi:uncharacterized DUF497 family protein
MDTEFSGFDWDDVNRPISARYMHRKEVQEYEKENPDL